MKEELEGFFVEDEKKFRQEDIAKLIGKLKRYAKLIGKDGRVYIEDKNLSGTDQSKIFLITRYLGSELSKLKPELGIKKEIASVTIKELAEFLSINEPNARARISQLIDEGFAKRPTKGSVQVESFRIKRFLDQLENRGNETKIKIKHGKTKKSVKNKKLSFSKLQKGRKITSLEKHKKSEIALLEKNLRDLKSYFGKKEYKKRDGEILIFGICNYLRTKMNKEDFTSGDVIAIYEAMIPLRIKVPLIRHIHQTMINLSQRGRKKMWLENKGDGIFSVSRIGKMRWEEIKNET